MLAIFAPACTPRHARSPPLPTTHVAVGRHHTFRYKLEAQIAAAPTTLIWEFSTQALDIAFSATFYSRNPNAAPLAIRELRRVKCNVMARIGQFTCREPGAIHLVWDNRWAW